jgi:hypothetical protein
MDKVTLKKRLLNHLGRVGLGIISASFILGTSPVSASDAAADAAKSVTANEGGKAALSEALKVAKSKPALGIAASIVCVSCIPIAGATASASMCVACGILIAKVLG